MKTLNEFRIEQIYRAIALADERKFDGEYGPWEAIGVLKSALSSVIEFLEQN